MYYQIFPFNVSDDANVFKTVYLFTRNEDVMNVTGKILLHLSKDYPQFTTNQRFSSSICT